MAFDFKNILAAFLAATVFSSALCSDGEMTIAQVKEIEYELEEEAEISKNDEAPRFSHHLKAGGGNDDLSFDLEYESHVNHRKRVEHNQQTLFLNQGTNEIPLYLLFAALNFVLLNRSNLVMSSLNYYC